MKTPGSCRAFAFGNVAAGAGSLESAQRRPEALRSLGALNSFSA